MPRAVQHLCAPRPCAAGVVYPKEGDASKASGRRVERFGPLTSFSVDYAGKTAQVGTWLLDSWLRGAWLLDVCCL